MSSSFASAPLTVLITGGSGLLGKRLTALLQEHGHHVRWLVRNPSGANLPSGVAAFRWSLNNGYVDPAALIETDAIIHLAGENVGGGRWTAARKKSIMDSRVDGTRALARALNTPNKVRTIVAASASGFYGNQPLTNPVTETSSAGNDFLANVCRSWEKEEDEMASATRRLVKFRIGVVLSTEGGALQRLAMPVRFGVGTVLGSGNQAISWIHIDDLCRMFLFALTNPELSGVYNAASPDPVDFRGFTHALAKQLRRPLWLPSVPAFVLRTGLGEMSSIILEGVALSVKKIQESGFTFRYPSLSEALADLL